MKVKNETKAMVHVHPTIEKGTRFRGGEARRWIGGVIGGEGTTYWTLALS